MELERFEKAKEIKRELDYWQTCLFRVKKAIPFGSVTMEYNGQPMTLEGQMFSDISDRLQMCIEGKIKLLEQQFKEL